MTRLVNIPFAMGQDESTSPIELPSGPLREAVNVRQRRFHSFGVRADYPAVAMTEYGGTLVPYDLYPLNNQLVALGDRQGLGKPTDLFSFVQQAVGNWKGTVIPGTNLFRVPQITQLRNVGQPQEPVFAIATARLAAVNGVVCLAYGFGSTIQGTPTYVHIFKASTNETLAVGVTGLANARVVTAGNSLWVIGVDTNSDLAGQRYDTTTSTALGAPVVLYTGTVTGNVFDAVSIKAASITQFAIMVRDAATTVIRRFNEAGTQQTTFAGPAVAASTLTMEADSVANRIVVAYRVGAADAFVQTYNLATNAAIAGPTAMFTEVVSGDLYIQRFRAGTLGMLLCTEDAGRVVRKAAFSEDVLGTVTRRRLVNYFLCGRGVSSTGLIVQPMCGEDNQLVAFGDQAFSNITSTLPLATLDQGISAGEFPGFDHVTGGDCCADATTGKLYWARVAEGTDGETIPFVSEFSMSSTERRQACQIANALLLSGGLPVHFDGRNSAESGFPERPLFDVTAPLTGGASGAALLPGGEYDYVAIYTYQDALNSQTLSMVSAVQTITLSAAQNNVTALVHAPHSLRYDFNTGSAPVIELYRTHCDLQTTTATITSDRDFLSRPAAAGDFNGLTLQLQAETGGVQTVTFGAADNTLDEIIAAINTQTTNMTATKIGGVFQVASDVPGIGGTITVIGGTTLAIGTGSLGLFQGQTDTGTTLAIKGTVFQLVQSVQCDASGDFGAQVSLTDGMSDATLLSQKPLYTNAERGALSGILEHEAPPPFEFCCAVGNRAFIGGLPDRSEVRISKELFQAEAIAFSSNSAFSARVEGDVTGVAFSDSTPVAFTSRAVYVFPSTFPDDNGDNGQLGPAQRLLVEEGCNNANSICATSIGVMYQSLSGKLMLLERGSFTSTWIGKRVQNTLEAFPVITSATYVEVDNVVCITCKNVAVNASIILVFDLLINQWYKDEIGTNVTRAACAYLGRLAYVDSFTNVVRLQSTSLTPASFISMRVKTGSINPFGGDGWGRLPSHTVPFEFRGDSKLRASISYDDGATFAVLKTFEFTVATGFVVGQFYRVQWWPRRVKGTSYVLLYEVLPPTSGAASEGLILQRYTLELDGVRPNRVRLPTGRKG
jgi:hypothetical protein